MGRIVKIIKNFVIGLPVTKCEQLVQSFKSKIAVEIGNNPDISAGGDAESPDAGGSTSINDVLLNCYEHSPF